MRFIILMERYLNNEVKNTRIIVSEGQRSEKKADTEGFEQSFEKMLGMIQEKEGKEFRR